MLFCCIGSLAINDRYYYSGAIDIDVIDLNCTGSEDNIWNCPSNALVGQHTCTSSYYFAGVACHSKSTLLYLLLSLLFITVVSSVNYTNCTTGQVRLSGSMEGRVELCHDNVWYGVCGDSYYSVSSVFCGNIGYQQGFYVYFALY